MRKWLPFAFGTTVCLVALLLAVSGEIGAARSRLVWKVIQGAGAIQDSVELLDIESRQALDKCAVALKAARAKR